MVGLTKWSYGQANVSSSDMNEMNYLMLTNLVISALNAGSSYEYKNLIINDLTSDSADTKTNWTYDSTNDRYTNTQTGTATLEFDNLLSYDQKQELSSGTKAVFLFVDKGGDYDVDSSLITNWSFESSITTGWTVVAGSWAQSTDHVTEGTYSARAAGFSNATPAEISQSVDFTNITKLSIDAYGTATNYQNQTMLVVTIGSTVHTYNPGQVTSWSRTYTIDCSSVTGSQTLKIGFRKANTFSSTNYGYVDNVLAVTNEYTNQDWNFYVSNDGGTTWETMNNGEIHNFSTAITDLAIKIENQRAYASSEVYNYVKGFGIFWGE